MEIRLRKALTEKDPAIVYDLVDDTKFFRADELSIARELVEEALENPDNGYLFLFAELDGETVGYICYGEIPGTIGSYDLYWLAVYRRYQGKGIGKHLLRAAEQDIIDRKGRQIYISTSGSEQYTHTRALYEKLDYEKAAVFKDFYLPGDDEVIYRKVIG